MSYARTLAPQWSVRQRRSTSAGNASRVTRQKARPRAGLFVRHDDEVKNWSYSIRGSSAGCGSRVEPQRFADTFGMLCCRVFHRSLRTALASSAWRCCRCRRSTATDSNAIIAGRDVNKIRYIDLSLLSDRVTVRPLPTLVPFFCLFRRSWRLRESIHPRAIPICVMRHSSAYAGSHNDPRLLLRQSSRACCGGFVVEVESASPLGRRLLGRHSQGCRPFSFWRHRCDYSPMLIGDSPGRLVGYIFCRTCHRCAHVDPDTLPPAPITENYRSRLRCSKCGGRGADIRIGWATPPSALPQGVQLAGCQVVYLSERARKSPVDAEEDRPW